MKKNRRRRKKKEDKTTKEKAAPTIAKDRHGIQIEVIKTSQFETALARHPSHGHL